MPRTTASQDLARLLREVVGPPPAGGPCSREVVIRVVPGRAALRVVGPGDRVRALARLLVPSPSPALRASRVVVVALRHADASLLLPRLRQHGPRGVRAAADVPTNSLVLQGPPLAVRDATHWVRRADRP